MLLVEAEVRRGRRVASDDATHANGQGHDGHARGAAQHGTCQSLMELELQVHGSALAVQLAALVEKRSVHDEGWLVACTAVGRYPCTRTAGLMGRPIDQLRRWSRSESFACEVLLLLTMTTMRLATLLVLMALVSMAVTRPTWRRRRTWGLRGARSRGCRGS